MNEESNSKLMSVFTATEKELVAFWGKRFSKVFPAFVRSCPEHLKVHFGTTVKGSWWVGGGGRRGEREEGGGHGGYSGLSH